VARLRLIDEGALDTGSVEALGARLGVSGRWLRNLFAEQLGASPLDVAQTRRVHLARRLLDESSLPLADVAAASGFGSARRLREALQRTFRRPASELRRAGAPAPAGIALEAGARAPFDAAPCWRSSPRARFPAWSRSREARTRARSGWMTPRACSR
jgi:AraC family transcriptional regulator of adaptative response / DNA-3-methyladenine glycosylase II